MAATGPSHPAVDAKVDILVVDDRPDKLLTYEVMLAPLNENLIRAKSGREALRWLLHKDFAVILLDVNMPAMDGFETAAMIRQRPRSETTPIIFVSAVNDSVTHVSRGYSLGAVDYILTPVVPEILRAKVAVFVDLFKKTEQIKKQAEERAKLIRKQAALVEAEAQQKRFAFLADASKTLALSLDSQETFQTLASLIVPRLADFCVIDLADDAGELHTVAVAQQEESRLRGLRSRFASSTAGRRIAARVFESGCPEMCDDSGEKPLRKMFDEDADCELVQTLGLTSLIAVPLRAQDRVLGTITMVNTSPNRRCGASELSLAEELAQRAALAVDNAALYRAAREARTEAEQASLAKDRFLAMLSHELRTPLTPVLASVSALEAEEQVPDSLRESLQIIRRNVELEARLIDDLLDLTRISKGKLQLGFEIVDAHKLLRNALDICRFETDHKQLQLEEDFAASRVRLQADPARLQQIFWNLIKNAVKFTPQGGRLRVGTSNDSAGAELRVEVQDSGRGIDPHLLPRIFNAFEQGERAHLGGLGLGLAISRALVEAHHGRITAESDGPGKGAKFTVVFPVSTAREVDHSSALPAPPAERKSKRILLVEDHEDTNRSLTTLLRQRGYKVDPAFDIRSALDLAAQTHFDVLITDIGLPDGSGIDLMSNLYRQRPLFGIALTGFGMEEDIRRSYDVGFAHHLVKPVDLNKLDALIQQGTPESARQTNTV